MGLFKKEPLNVYRIELYGMRCGMCESHVNTIIRNKFKVKKVTSSHSKNETLIYSKGELDIEEIREVLKPTGYEIKEIKKL